MGNRDQLLHLKTQSCTLLKEWMNPDCLPPFQTLGLYHSSEPPNQSCGSAPAWGWVFKQKAHRAIRFLLLHQDLSPYTRELHQALALQDAFATSIFGSKSCTESLSQLPQWKGEGCVLLGGKQNPATVTNGDIRSWHRGEKVMLHISPSCRC